MYICVWRTMVDKVYIVKITSHGHSSDDSTLSAVLKSSLVGAALIPRSLN